MKIKSLIVSAVAAGAFAGNAFAAADLVVTEFVTKSDQTEDWFEVTNFGDTAANVTGWQYDDESADILDAVAITGITSIAPGESVIILNDITAGADAAFRAFWGGLPGVQIGVHDGSGLGKGDGATLFDAADNIILQGFYGDGDSTDPSDLIPDSHAGVWVGGEEWDSANYTPGGFIGGVANNGVNGIFASSSNDGANGAPAYASPGTAVPEPASMILAGLGGLALLSRRG